MYEELFTNQLPFETNCDVECLFNDLETFTGYVLNNMQDVPRGYFVLYVEPRLFQKIIDEKSDAYTYCTSQNARVKTINCTNVENFRSFQHLGVYIVEIKGAGDFDGKNYKLCIADDLTETEQIKKNYNTFAISHDVLSSLQEYNDVKQNVLLFVIALLVITNLTMIFSCTT